jgi:LmbE family N-acetylglucosaminyl deacetylase
MIRFHFEPTPGNPLRILCLGAHSDDIEIGCGGTLLELKRRFQHNLQVRWMVFSSNEIRAEEARNCAGQLLAGVKEAVVDIRHFRDGFFPYDGAMIKEVFEDVKKNFSPDLVLTHYRDDRHQDHRLISDLTWNTFRDHLILEYEIPKYDGDLGIPNCFVSLEEGICEEKCEAIYTHFVSQREKHWFSKETLMGLMRIRGMESATQYAEAFHCRKIVM